MVVTADARYFQYFQSAAGKLGTQCALAEVESVAMLSAASDQLVFDDNVAIAREVCRRLGVDADVVDACIADACAAGGQTLVSTRTLEGKKIHFVDLFSANDIDSTQRVQQWASAHTHCPKPWVALFCNRADRPLRMRSFTGFLGGSEAYEHVAIIGDSVRLAARHFRLSSSGRPVLTIGGFSAARVVEKLLHQLPYPEFTLIGMGNEKGLGQDIAQFFREA
jgi:hypothetical protein